MDNRRTQPIGIELVKRGIVGDSTQNSINQKIDYVLRYW